MRAILIFSLGILSFHCFASKGSNINFIDNTGNGFSLTVTGDGNCSTPSGDSYLNTTNNYLHIEDQSNHWYSPCKDSHHYIYLNDSSGNTVATVHYESNFISGTLGYVQFNGISIPFLDNNYNESTFIENGKKYIVDLYVYAYPGNGKHHTFNITVGDDYSNWMSDVFKQDSRLLNEKLYSIILPESHDSFAYNFDKNSYEYDTLSKYSNILSEVSGIANVGNFISGIAKTQYNIDYQLNNGIRAFDVRLANKFNSSLTGGQEYNTGNVFYHPHGLKGQNIGEMINDHIIPFLNKHKSEFVLLDFSKANLNNIEDIKNLEEFFSQEYLNYSSMLITRDDLMNSSISQLIAMNKRILIVGDMSDLSMIDSKYFTYLYGYTNGLGTNVINQISNNQKIDSYNETMRSSTDSTKGNVLNAINSLSSIKNFDNIGILTIQNQATIPNDMNNILSYVTSSGSNGAFTDLLLSSKLDLQSQYYSSNGVYSNYANQILLNKPKNYIMTIMDDFAGETLAATAKRVTLQGG